LHCDCALMRLAHQRLWPLIPPARKSRLASYSCELSP
jgi:hypothetical protein